MRYSKDKKSIIDGDKTIPCIEENKTYRDLDLETVLPYLPPVISDEQIVIAAEAQIRGVRNQIYANGDAGQTASYAQKLEQARAYKAADYPASAAEYAYIVEGAKDQDFTKRELADAIIAQFDAYVMLDAKIEAARTIVKVKVAAAADNDKQTAADLVVSELQAVIAAIMAA